MDQDEIFQNHPIPIKHSKVLITFECCKGNGEDLNPEVSIQLNISSYEDNFYYIIINVLLNL